MSKYFPLFCRTRVFVGDFIVIDEDGYAFPCPYNLIEKRKLKWWVAADSVDNSCGNCGSKQLLVYHPDETFDVQITKKFADITPSIIMQKEAVASSSE